MAAAGAAKARHHLQGLHSKLRPIMDKLQRFLQFCDAASCTSNLPHKSLLHGSDCIPVLQAVKTPLHCNNCKDSEQRAQFQFSGSPFQQRPFLGSLYLCPPAAP